MHYRSRLRSRSYSASGGTPPEVPTDVTVSSRTSSTITVTATVDPAATSVKIYANGVLSATVGYADPYTATGLSALTEYDITLVASNAGGDSAASDPATVYTLAETPANYVVNVPEGSNIVDALEHSWEDPGGATGFVILDENDNIVGSPGLTTSYTEAGLQACTQYNRKIKAINAVGDSLPSATVQKYTRPAAMTSIGTLDPTADGFLVSSPTLPDGTLDVAINIDGTITILEDPSFTGQFYKTGLSPNTQYGPISLAAANPDGDTGTFTEYDPSTPYTACQVPTGFAVTSRAGTLVYCAWDIMPGDAAEYQLEYEDSGWYSTGESVYGPGPSLPQAFTLPGTGDYQIRLAAINGDYGKTVYTSPIQSGAG